MEIIGKVSFHGVLENRTYVTSTGEKKSISEFAVVLVSGADSILLYLQGNEAVSLSQTIENGDKLVVQARHVVRKSADGRMFNNIVVTKFYRI